MDQIKIGKFISKKRKELNITQSDLAERLFITDRAISKWERGLSLPDAGTMPELCKILGITINDLFSGEKVDMKDNEKKYEENLLEMIKEKQDSDKKLLALEIIVGIPLVVLCFVLIMIAGLANMDNWVRVLIIVISFLLLFIYIFIALKIEQVAGYYECASCHHKYVPTYNSVFMAMHIGRTRYMKCPKCGRKSWNKKVLK